MGALDLSSAYFFLDAPGGNPNGQYGDGVIYTFGSPGFPDFFIPAWTLDAATTYTVEITFDPASIHDGGGRRFWLSGVTPGNEQNDYWTITSNFGDLYDGSGNTSDVATVTIGPGVNGWDDPTLGVAAGYARVWFETDVAGAVSQILVTPFGTLAPPLRLTNRSDMFASAPSLTRSGVSRQGGNRVTGYP